MNTITISKIVLLVTGVMFISCSKMQNEKESKSAADSIAVKQETAVDVKTSYAEVKGRKIAYRSLGKGTPLILCNRYRGILDTWDPAFLDALAKDFNVITFDYSGFGLSTGTPATDMATFSQDVFDLMDALRIQKPVIGGWSFGGLVAQTIIARYPDKVSHGILIGTGPLGKNETPIEPIFFERSSIVNNSLDDEIVLFFEPQWEPSRKAAIASHERIAQRKKDLDVPVPQELWANYHKGFADCIADKDGLREKILTSKVPMLLLIGDHDISFPIQNWYVLTKKLEATQLVVFPRTGHGPQHEFPQQSADFIRSFYANVSTSR
jgi:pimeloyl-ACP methyl ester carboxylesterase